MNLTESKMFIFEEGKDFNSSAISKVTVSITELAKTCSVIFRSNDKEYIYSITDQEFVDNLRYTVVNDKSMGQFITSCIRSNKLSQINTIVE